MKKIKILGEKICSPKEIKKWKSNNSFSLEIRTKNLNIRGVMYLLLFFYDELYTRSCHRRSGRLHRTQAFSPAEDIGQTGKRSEKHEETGTDHPGSVCLLGIFSRYRTAVSSILA